MIAEASWNRIKLGAVVALILYATASAWIVRGLGESYRQSLRDRRIGPSIAEKPPSPAPILIAANPPAPSKEPTPSPPPIKPEPAPPIVVKPSPDPPIAPPAPIDPPLDPIAALLASKAKLNLAKLSPQDERDLGRALNQVILAYTPEPDDNPWLQRVIDAAEPLLPFRQHKDIEFTFTVLDSDEVNAFSTPGGYIYIYRGLFDLFGDDEDYILQFVIAHEIAHVDQGHALRCLDSPDLRTLNLGSVAMLYGLIIPSGYYPADLDYEADRWAFNQMKRLGMSDRKCLAFLRKFVGYAAKNKFTNGLMKPAPASKSPPVDNHFRAHPSAGERLKRLTKLTAPLGPEVAKPAR